MKIRAIVAVLLVFLLAGCSEAGTAASSSEGGVSSISTPAATETPAPEASATPEPVSEASTPEPSPAPTPEPTPVPAPAAAEHSASPAPAQPTQEPAATEAPASATDTTEPGAIPFSLAEGTDKWWYIDSSDSAYWAVQDGINAIRASVGLGPLTMDDTLSSIASTRCQSFVTGGPFDHSGMVTASEICARGPIGTAAAVCEAWKNSPNHYAAMVNSQFTKMGVSCWFCSTDQGKYTFWTVTFE